MVVIGARGVLAASSGRLREGLFEVSCRCQSRGGGRLGSVREVPGRLGLRLLAANPRSTRMAANMFSAGPAGAAANPIGALLSLVGAGQQQQGTLDIASCTLDELCRTLTAPRQAALLQMALSRIADRTSRSAIYLSSSVSSSKSNLLYILCGLCVH